MDAGDRRVQAAQLETILDRAPLGVYLVDDSLRLLHVNPIARAAWGDLPDLDGRDFGDVVRTVFNAAYADQILALFRHTLATGESYVAPAIAELRADRGVVEHYEWRIDRVPLPGGGHGIVCYFRDISEQVRAREALEAAARQKDEFLAMLAHELRNPLAPIRTAGELLARTALKDARAQTVIGIIRRQVGQLTRLVDDLLDVSRITRGSIELHREPVELRGVIGQAVETVEPLVRERRHTLDVTVPARPAWVSGDRARLVQCVTNLLTNAIKYTNQEGHIGIALDAAADEAVVVVSDDGIGIGPELLPRVFDLFVQGERTLDRAAGGLGIGLSVVRRLVEMHGGSIEARSEGAGRGSTFTIRLPAIAAAEPARSATSASQVAARRVLVVDDNVDAANSLVLLLRYDGHEAEAVYDAGDVLALVASRRPDAVLLDVGLPGMNGYELARRLRAAGGEPRPCLIAVTGYGQPEDRQRALEAGFDAHLVKPVAPDVLAGLLARLPVA